MLMDAIRLLVLDDALVVVSHIKRFRALLIIDFGARLSSFFTAIVNTMLVFS